jgi:Histone methylation protein DOT1
VVDVSTSPSNLSYRNEVERRRSLPEFLCAAETDASLFEATRLRERLEVLDRLDAEFGGFETHTNLRAFRVHRSARALRRRIEAANAELYLSIRSEIIRGGRPETLLQWMQNSISENGSRRPSPGLGFDWRDELASGVLQLREPREPDLCRLPEIIPYQPTPVRHILHLIAESSLSEGSVFVDLGSGLGHVPLLVSMLAGVRSVGIEIHAAYVASAQECAQRLRLGGVRFVAEDARATDLSSGTVFYLYSPFTGSILTDVLTRLRRESLRRPIRICSLGPCTKTLASEPWLKTNGLPDVGRIAVFTPR